MQQLKKIIEVFRKKRRFVSEEEVLNIIREYLQVIVLKIIFQSKYGTSLSFMGGTCLRICYDLKRYSEDLDFCLDDPKKEYDFSKMVTNLQKQLNLLGFELSTNIHDEKIVQKAFLRFASLGDALGLKNFRKDQKDQKLNIKLEVDTNPPPLKEEGRESFFITRFQEIFPLLKHNLPTLFAGKVLAILNRPYVRGRDYYDLIWYLTQKSRLNFSYLEMGNEQIRLTSKKEVVFALSEQVKKVKPEDILKDIGRFLEDPSEERWLKDYQRLFTQLIHQWEQTPF